MSVPLARSGFLWCIVAVPLALLPLALALPPWLDAALLALWGMAAALGWRGRVLAIWVRIPVALAAAGLTLAAYGFGFGRDTGAALLATMLVMKLLELRSLRDARSVLGFSLFASSAAFLLQQGPAMLALSLVGALTVIAAFAALADIEAGIASSPPVRTRLRSAAMLVVLSLPLALVGFFLFPRLATPLWGVPAKAAEARTGLSEEMSPGDIAALYIDDSPVLRISFDGAAPPPAAMYWRGPVLSYFDGRAWLRPRFGADLPAPSVEALAGPISYEVTQEPTDRRYVLALDVATGAPPETAFDVSRTLIADRRLEDVSKRRMRSAVAYRLGIGTPRTLLQWATRLPEGYNPRTVALMRQWRDEGADDAALIRRLLGWFNAEFSYTLEPVLLGRDSVDDFLFRTRAGYCEHFASAFAVAMRAAGVPARVVTGYQGGYLNPLGNYWVVRQSDAHAWTEVWLDGQGWVRIDPTSAVAPERISSGTRALSGIEIEWWGPARDAADWALRQWNDLVLGFDAARQRSLLRPLGIDSTDWRQIGTAFAISAGLALAVTLLLVLRQRGPRPDPLVLAYGRFLQRIGRAGLPPRRAEGPAAFAERAARAFPSAAERISSLSARYVAWRYGGVPFDAGERRQLAVELGRFRLDHGRRLWRRRA